MSSPHLNFFWKSGRTGRHHANHATPRGPSPSHAQRGPLHIVPNVNSNLQHIVCNCAAYIAQCAAKNGCYFGKTV